MTRPHVANPSSVPQKHESEPDSGAAPEGAPHPIDVWVGKRIQARRKALCMSQSDLGRKLGVSFQQVQKYENAGNRVSASRLHEIAKALRCEMTFFFKPRDAQADEPVDVLAFADSHEAMRTLRAFAQVTDARTRAAIVTLTEVLAELSASAAAAIAEADRIGYARAQAEAATRFATTPSRANGASAPSGLPQSPGSGSRR